MLGLKLPITPILVNEVINDLDIAGGIASTQLGYKLPLQRVCVTEEIAENDCNEPIRIHQKRVEFFRCKPKFTPIFY